MRASVGSPDRPLTFAAVNGAASSSGSKSMPCYPGLSPRTAILTALVLYGVFCYLFVMYPSPERILFIQTVTGTRYVDIGAFAGEDPFLFEKLSPVTRGILTKSELEALRAACLAAQVSHVDLALHPNSSSMLMTQNNADGPGATTVTSSSSAAAPRRIIPSLAVKRYNAKLHVVCPLLLVLDYPSCYLIAAGDAGLARLPFITANLISFVHPFCALLAGALFAKAVQSRGTSLLFGSSSTPTAVELMTTCDSTSTGEANPKMSRTLSAVTIMMESSQPGVAPSGGGQVCTAVAVGPTGSCGSAGGGGMLEGSSVADAVGSPMSLLFDAEETETKDKAGHIALSATSVNFTMVRAGCIFFFLRNWLDTLDGVVFRLQRSYSGATGPVATNFGFNGHSLDVLADAAGGFLASIGMLLFLFRRQVLLSRLLFSLLTTRFGISFRWMTARGISVARCVAFAGLMVPAVASSLWEIYMVKYSNLFDTHSGYNPQIFELERHFHVRLNMALWSLMYADTIFYVYLVAMFFDSIWPVVQFYAGVAYLWLAVIMVHSHYVWGSVIYANPAARAILMQNQA
jgi:hypothetical protein